LNAFTGLSELWGSGLDDFEDGNGNEPSSDSSRTAKSKENIGDSIGTNDIMGGPIDTIPCYNEKDKDGKQYFWSQILAKDEWSNLDMVPEEKMAMTLDDYNKQLEDILTQAKEEMREMEAILMSKPGNDPVRWDYNEEKLAPMSDVTNGEESEEITKQKQETVI
jgi:hypothetical protein